MQLAGYGVALECIIIEEGETSRTSFNSETVFAGVHTLNRAKPLYSKCNRGDPREKNKTKPRSLCELRLAPGSELLAKSEVRGGLPGDGWKVIF